MEYFVQIKLNELPYFAYRHAIEMTMRRLHGTMRHFSGGNVGTSFSEYHKGDVGTQSHLGNVINLVSDSPEPLKAVAEHLDLSGIVEGNAITMSSVKPVPDGLPRATFRRRRHKERAIKRGGFQETTYPFFRYGKRHDHHQYRVYVEQCSPVDSERSFNSYGLSSTASVPVIPATSI